MKYIDADKLKAEIERFSATEYGDNTFGDDIANGALDYVLEKIIPSLQQEQPEVDEMVKSAEDHAYFAGQEKMREKLLEWIDKMCEENKGFSETELVVTLDKLKEKIKSL